MKKVIKRMYGMFMMFSILVLNFMPIIELNAEEINVSSSISFQVIGDDLEYDVRDDNNPNASNIHFTINNAGQQYDVKSSNVEWQKDGQNKKIGFTSSNNNYYYNKYDETVTFTFYTSWDEVITSLVINGVDYVETTDYVPTEKSELIRAFDNENNSISFDVEVPYNDAQEGYDYVIVVEAEKQSELFMGNFLWSYDENANVSDDEKIPFGTLEFVSATYNGHTYTSVEELNSISIEDGGNVFEWSDGEKKDEYSDNDDSGIGEAVFPTGTVLTIKLIPDIGYQLTSLELNDQPFTAGDEDSVGEYTFTITGGNFHLGASFTETDNKVEVSSSSVLEGSIGIDLDAEDSFEYGTAKLEVNDVNPTTKDDFEDELPEGYEVENYLDISLYNSIYKANNTGANSWDSEVESLTNEAEVTLQLSEDMTGKEISVIHEMHTGDHIDGYEVLPATYNEETNSITFSTTGFSNYAVISKDSNDTTTTISDDNGNKISFDNPDGKNYVFNVISYIGLTDEELAEFEMDRDEYNYLYNGIVNKAKQYGNVLAIYELSVVDQDAVDPDDGYLHDGPFKIKIKMTEEMKKYNTFSIVYTDVDNDFATEEPISLTVDGNYLVGTLNHLSVYTIVGKNVTTDNPKTGDDINISIILGTLSLISLLGCGIYLNKKKLFK